MYWYTGAGGVYWYTGAGSVVGGESGTVAFPSSSPTAGSVGGVTAGCVAGVTAGEVARGANALPVEVAAAFDGFACALPDCDHAAIAENMPAAPTEVATSPRVTLETVRSPRSRERMARVTEDRGVGGTPTSIGIEAKDRV